MAIEAAATGFGMPGWACGWIVGPLARAAAWVFPSECLVGHRDWCGGGGFFRLAWPVFCHRLSDLVACGPDTCGLDGHRSSDSGVGINNLWRELCGAWVGQFGAHEGLPIATI